MLRQYRLLVPLGVPIHFVDGEDLRRTVCGLYGIHFTSRQRDEVGCLNCRKTKRFRNNPERKVTWST